MPEINRLLDAAKARVEPHSDAEVARRLGVSKAALSLWRSGGVITEKNLAELVALAGSDATSAVVVLREQAQTDAQAQVWGSLKDRLLPIMSTGLNRLRAVVGLEARH